MKKTICDICWNKHQKMIPAKYRLTVKDQNQRLAIDSCEQHKTFLSDRPKMSISELQIAVLRGE